MTVKYKKTNFKIYVSEHWTEIFIGILAFILLFGWFKNSFNNYIVSEYSIIDSKLITVSPKVSGNVIHVYAEKSQEVKKGDLLLEIDPTYYEMRLLQAEQNLRNAKIKNNIQQDENQIPAKLSLQQDNSKTPNFKTGFSKNKFSSYESNYNDDNLSHEIENEKDILTDNKYNTEKQDIIQDNKNDEKETKEEIPANIKKLENEVEQAKLDLSCTKVYAPRDGIISNVDVVEGDYINVAQPIMLIIPKRLNITSIFKINSQTEIKEGMSAIINIPKYPHKKFKGIVESVRIYPDNIKDLSGYTNTDNTPKYVVKILFTRDYTDYKITPASNAVVKIITNK